MTEHIKMGEVGPAISGALLALTGPHTLTPLAAETKMLTCVSLATPETDSVALNMAVGPVGMLALDHWEVVIGRQVGIAMLEDHGTSFPSVNRQEPDHAAPIDNATG